MTILFNVLGVILIAALAWLFVRLGRAPGREGGREGPAGGRRGWWGAVLVGLALCGAAAGPPGSGDATAAPGAAAGDRLPNLHCPVQPDRVADPAFHATHDGREVYFCCAMCRRKFLADPAPFLARLPQFGGSEPAPVAAAAGAGADAPDTGRAEPAPAGRPRSFLEALGRFHPAVVHFPLALLLAAGLAELLALLGGWEPGRRAVPYLLAVAAPAALLAAGLGLAMAATTRFAADQAAALALHRAAGLATCGLALLALALLRWRDAAGRLRRGLFLVALLLAGAAVALAGHQGGVLVWGADWLPF